jgi:hypothetical protein
MCVFKSRFRCKIYSFRLLVRVFGPKKEAETKEWKILENEEIHA